MNIRQDRVQWQFNGRQQLQRLAYEETVWVREQVGGNRAVPVVRTSEASEIKKKRRVLKVRN